VPGEKEEKMKTLLLAATALTVASTLANAAPPAKSSPLQLPEKASITVTPACDGKCHVIRISGHIDLGSADRFKEAVYSNSVLRAVVVLNSGGGSLWDGLDIGEFVRERGFATFVPTDNKCVSVCASIWASGTTQYVPSEGGARIGFHGSFVLMTDRNGVPAKNAKPLPDPDGNAVTGAYFYHLGYSYKTIMQLTKSAPDEALWLTTEKQARELGFTYKGYASTGDLGSMAAGN
jgi:hypothetical protein